MLIAHCSDESDTNHYNYIVPSSVCLLECICHHLFLEHEALVLMMTKTKRPGKEPR